MAQQNNTTTQNQQSAAANSLRQRLTQNSANNKNATQNQQNNNPFRRQPQNNTSRFGGNRNQQNNRFGSNRFSRGNVEWTVRPMHKIAVRVSLEGLGDPFHRLLNQPLNVEFGDPEKSIQAIYQDDELQQKLTEALDAAWEAYQFEGAAMLYPWDTDVTRAFTVITQPVPEPEKDTDENDDDNNSNNKQQNNAEPEEPPFECLRAIDAAFVLNILARTRSNVVVGNTPLALEPAFLKQTFVCDDPRIVAIARATGCVGDNWT